MKTATLGFLLAALGGCLFSGEGTQGLPCNTDTECGGTQKCIEHVCGGPSALATDASIGASSDESGSSDEAPMETNDDDEVRTLFDTHFFGTVAMIKAVLPGMRASRSGAIVNISSIGATLTPVGSGYYSAAKAAIEGVSGALRGELAPLGISVTTVAPRPVPDPVGPEPSCTGSLRLTRRSARYNAFGPPVAAMVSSWVRSDSMTSWRSRYVDTNAWIPDASTATAPSAIATASAA